MTVMKEDAEEVHGMTLEEFMEGEDIRVTSNGVIRVLYY